MDFNPYKVLAVDPSADPDVIAAAYRALSKKFHPDVNKAPEAEARMRELNRAYDMLKDPAQRRQVDADLARSSSAGSSAGSYRARSGGSSYSSPSSRTSRPSTGPSHQSSGPDWSN